MTTDAPVPSKPVPPEPVPPGLLQSESKTVEPAEPTLEPTLEPMRTDSSDQSLLLRYCQGDEDAAAELYERYADRLLTLAERQTSSVLKQRLDAEDMVQSVFRTFFRRAAGGQYALPEGRELWKLLVVIGLNKIRYAGNHHRAAKRSVTRTTSVAHLDQSELEKQTSHETDLHMLKLTIDELLQPLPEFMRAIVQLRITGYEISEIAKITGRSKRSIERNLQQFRNQLGGILNANL